MKKWLLRLSILSATLLVVNNCGSSKDSQLGKGAVGLRDSVEPNFTSIYNNIFAASCAQCHTAGSQAAGGSQLDLSSQGSAYNTLQAYVTGTSSSSTCGRVPLVAQGNSRNSYLMAVLSSNYWHNNFYSAGCSPYQTHHQDTNLSSDELSAIAGWIDQGAQNN